MRSLLFLLLFLSVSFVFSPSVFAANHCVKSFQPTGPNEIIRKVDPNYVADLVLNQNNKYTVTTVPFRTEVLNQGTRGFCHMYSLYAELVREYKSRNEGKDPNISIYYWAYHHWLRRGIETALDPKAGSSIPEGSWYEITFDLIKDVGVMTKDQWEALGGQSDIETAYKNSIQEGQLKSLMNSSHIQLRLFESFFNTEGTEREIQKRLSKLLQTDWYSVGEFKKIVKEKQKKLKSNSTALSAEQVQILKDVSDGKLRHDKLNSEQLTALKKAFKKDIENEVRRVFASIFFSQAKSPEEVDKTEENVRLSQSLFPEVHQSTLNISVNEEMKKNAPIRFVQRKESHLYFNTSIKNLEEIISQEIEEKGNSVWIGYDHNDNFVDNSSGAMTIKGFKFNPVNPYMTRKERDIHQIFDGGHAVQLIGVQRALPTKEQLARGQKGDIVAFIMQNSWGEKPGQKGIYTMGIDYFRAFIWVITTRDEDGKIDRAVTEANQLRQRKLQLSINEFKSKRQSAKN